MTGYGATATSKMYPGYVCLREAAKLTSTADIGRKAAVPYARAETSPMGQTMPFIGSALDGGGFELRLGNCVHDPIGNSN